MPDEDQFDKYYHEYDPDRLGRTPEEVLAKLERVFGPLPEEIVRRFWTRLVR